MYCYSISIVNKSKTYTVTQAYHTIPYIHTFLVSKSDISYKENVGLHVVCMHFLNWSTIWQSFSGLFRRIPDVNSGCGSYFTAVGGRIRAYQGCSLGMCMKTSSCSCGPCDGSCPSTGRPITVSISPSGRVSTSRVITGSKSEQKSEVTGDTNPDNIPALPSQGGSRAASSQANLGGLIQSFLS